MNQIVGTQLSVADQNIQYSYPQSSTLTLTIRTGKLKAVNGL